MVAIDGIVWMHVRTLNTLLLSGLFLASMNCGARLPSGANASCHVMSSQMMFVPNQHSSHEALQAFTGMSHKHSHTPKHKTNFSWEVPFLIGTEICLKHTNKKSIETAFENAPINRFLDTSVMGLEALLEYAFVIDNEAEAKRLLQDIKTIASPLDNIKLTDKGQELRSQKQTLQYLSWSIYYYYMGRLALKNDDLEAAIDALLFLCELDVNYFVVPTPTNIEVSPNYTNLKRAAIVGNATKIMDLSLQIFNTDDSAVLTPEQHVRIFKIEVLRLSRENQTLQINQAWLAPQFLKKYQSEYENGTKNPEKILAASRNIFETGYAKFRESWPYDRGPYLWKSVLKKRQKIKCQNRQVKEICLSNIVLESIKD
ncbi:MAG TPA: hypothetical protein ENK06_13545 [Gammaproteobacteria bacterium]|nr:hypothetical protein [Gammaproteobacteria bacterium]